MAQGVGAGHGLNRRVVRSTHQRRVGGGRHGTCRRGVLGCCGCRSHGGGTAPQCFAPIGLPGGRWRRYVNRRLRCTERDPGIGGRVCPGGCRPPRRHGDWTFRTARCRLRGDAVEHHGTRSRRRRRRHPRTRRRSRTRNRPSGGAGLGRRRHRHRPDTQPRRCAEYSRLGP